MDLFSSSRGKKDGKRSGLFRKKSASPSRSPTPSYDFPNYHPRPPVNGYATPETNTPWSPFHPAGNRTPDRPRKSSEQSRDTRSNASPFHPFRSPSPSPYHTPDRLRDYYEAMYEPEASPFHPAGSRSPPPCTRPDRHSNYGNEQQFEEQDGHVTPLNSSPRSPFHPAASRSPPYRTPDRRRNHHEDEQFEAMYGADGNVLPRNSAPPSPLHGYYDDNQSTYLFPEIGTPPRSNNTTPVHHNYQIVAAETYEQFDPPDESQSFTQQEEEIQSAYVSVANYRVRVSVSETLQAILDKHGDIAASSKFHSTVTRSYYLESIAAVVMELRSTVLRDLTKTRVAEMAAVVKDMESVKIHVSWLKKAVAELAEAVEYLGQYEETKVEREVCERDLKAGKEEMEEMRAELMKKEKEVRECREKVTVAAGKLGQLEMIGWRLNKNLELSESKVHKFQGQDLLLQV
uniref:Phospholipase-like protein (PEARLI 4) family protein n=1 Tax=Noccaea caerulescens TaxID=107243 RepID=A0A1J3GAT1_NOCCA